MVSCYSFYLNHNHAIVCVRSEPLASLSGGRVSSPHGGDVPSEISSLSSPLWLL